MNDNIDELNALNHLNNLDKEHGVNNVVEVHKEEPSNSLGKARNQAPMLSAAEESPWKILDPNLLPSKGMFYHPDSEILLKSAKNKEIKHWSTMDEYDPLDVKEKINFILNKCVKFKIKGYNRPFNFNDFCHADTYHLMFRIHELTFPNKENKLIAKLKCKSTTCGHVNNIHATSQNLKGFEIPEDLLSWYDPQQRCFYIEHERLGDPVRIYLPTNGVVNELRKYKKKEAQLGRTIDESFYMIAPYMIKDWRDLDERSILSIKSSYDGWSNDRYTGVYKFVDALKKNSLNKVLGVCEKCKSRLEDHIFLGGSFTTKDIFIISGGFNEFIGA